MDEIAFWQAVLARDPGFDGKFVYGVRSTRVYCRPICPSRKPRREQVVFFSRPEAAEEAGFRACRRCRPEVEGGGDRQVVLVEEVCRRIQGRPDELLSLADLAAEAGVSPHHLQRVFKRVTGVSPRQYAEACRLGLLKERLRQGDGVTDALYVAGYGSSSRLYERAPQQLGMTPTVYRRGGQGTSIRYTLIDCPLGRLLVASTERGVCSISLGEDDAGLEAALRREYPGAEIRRDDSALRPWASLLTNHLAGGQPHLELPLDVRATAFQWRVWEELRRIPYGSTRSYGEVACAAGCPGGARAVARACAANPVALAIPCHRVVRGDGGLGGYRWGVDRKRLLLSQERAAIQGPSAAGGEPGAATSTPSWPGTRPRRPSPGPRRSSRSRSS